jgi:hypothetical protein
MISNGFPGDPAARDKMSWSLTKVNPATQELPFGNDRDRRASWLNSHLSRFAV